MCNSHSISPGLNTKFASCSKLECIKQTSVFSISHVWFSVCVLYENLIWSSVAGTRFPCAALGWQIDLRVLLLRGVVSHTFPCLPNKLAMASSTPHTHTHATVQVPLQVHCALSCTHSHNTDTTDAYLCAPLQLPDVWRWELQQRSQ